MMRRLVSAMADVEARAEAAASETCVSTDCCRAASSSDDGCGVARLQRSRLQIQPPKSRRSHKVVRVSRFSLFATASAFFLWICIRSRRAAPIGSEASATWHRQLSGPPHVLKVDADDEPEDVTEASPSSPTLERPLTGPFGEKDGQSQLAAGDGSAECSGPEARLPSKAFPGPLLRLEIWKTERRRRHLRKLQAQVASTRERIAAAAKLQADADVKMAFEEEAAAFGREGLALGEQMRAVGERLQSLRRLAQVREAEARVCKERRKLENLRVGPLQQAMRFITKAAKIGSRVLGVAVASRVLLKAVTGGAEDEPVWTSDGNETVVDNGMVPQGRHAHAQKGEERSAQQKVSYADKILHRLDEVLWLYFTKKLFEGKLFPKFHFPPKVPNVALEDVAGLGAAKREAAEVAEFLRAPARYDAVGAQCPRGVLLTGPPGCGKTMLSKAIAATAGVPFLEMSGADFNNKFAGVGTQKVKEMFARARRLAPAVVFIDEIDYIGRARSGHGGSVETDRTAALTQFLTEMDGFKGRDGVVVMATTNRPDLLDRALLRPGRFDRQLVLPLPDVSGRELILRSHARKVMMSEDIDWAAWSRRTSGFSGAELAGLVNEAAVNAAREDDKERAAGGAGQFGGVRDKHVQMAYSKALLGLPDEKKPSEQRRNLTALHEAGHAVVNEAMRASFPEEQREGFRTVAHISILAQGNSGGNTQFAVPKEGEELSQGRAVLLAEMAGIMGGRAAEHLARGADGVTMGASSDMAHATSLAERMVRAGGLGEAVGPRIIEQGRQYSEALLQSADKEVGKLVRTAQAAALETLRQNHELWIAVAAALMEHESLDGDAFRALVKKHGIVPGRLVGIGSGGYTGDEHSWRRWLRFA